jgi:hypothetical protein
MGRYKTHIQTLSKQNDWIDQIGQFLAKKKELSDYLGGVKIKYRKRLDRTDYDMIICLNH